jgi:hypothetical protein
MNQIPAACIDPIGTTHAATDSDRGSTCIQIVAGIRCIDPSRRHELQVRHRGQNVANVSRTQCSYRKDFDQIRARFPHRCDFRWRIRTSDDRNTCVSARIDDRTRCDRSYKKLSPCSNCQFRFPNVPNRAQSNACFPRPKPWLLIPKPSHPTRSVRIGERELDASYPSIEKGSDQFAGTLKPA